MGEPSMSPQDPAWGKVSDCWNQIGVMGDRTCPQLQQFIQCRNCPVYAKAGRSLLERELSDLSATADYLQDWTDLLAHAKESDTSTGVVSLFIFRLGVEWLALPPTTCKEVTEYCPIHKIPHRSNNILAGIVNIRGEIQLCIHLDNLLEIETISNDRFADPTLSREQALTVRAASSQLAYRRMVVAEKNGSTWVFAADEIHGIHHASNDDLRNVPTTLSKSQATYTKGIIKWHDKNVAYLDEELLFYTLYNKIYL